MLDFGIKGHTSLSLLLPKLSKLYDISQKDMADIMLLDIASDKKYLLLYIYSTFKEGDFCNTITLFFNELDNPSTADFNIWIEAWRLALMLNTEIIVSPTNDIKIPYQWFLIKDGVFYLATEIIPDDSDEQDYGMIIDYTTLEPTFDRLPKAVQDYILANTQ